MKLSVEWLKRYAELPESPQEIADAITMHIAEVEEVIDAKGSFAHIVVGKITEVNEHTNADSLRLCMVDVGMEDDVQIVCGGSNLEVGQYVVVALPGAKVRWHGEGDLIELAKTKIRGESSFGMICAAEEVGLGKEFPSAEEREIVDLTAYIDAHVEKNTLSSVPGMNIAALLEREGTIIDIDNKTLTHRGDLFSHQGFARELSTVFSSQLNIPDAPKPAAGNAVDLQVGIQTTNCRRYMGVALEVSGSIESPAWMKQALAACGVSSHGLVVDVTNYVMLEYGQPLHAFDASIISDSSIIVRDALPAEKFMTLDDKEVDLSALPKAVVIADATGPQALAGIIGGQGSAITESTQHVILESANFNPIAIRQTAQALAKRTDASTRHEKKLHPNMCEYALYRAVELLVEYGNAVVESSVVDVYPETWSVNAITLEQAYLNRVLGAEINSAEVMRILTSLGCSVELSDDQYIVTPPFFRTDLTIAEDLVEEIARMYGYGQLPQHALISNLRTPVRDVRWQGSDELVDFFTAVGASETMHYSYYGEAAIKQLGLDADSHVEMLNPMNVDQQYLRSTMLHGMLQSFARNQQTAVQLESYVEYGHVYLKNPQSPADWPIEIPVVTLIKHASNAESSYREVKGIANALMNTYGIDAHWQIDEDHKPYAAAGTHASWLVENTPIVQEYLLSDKTLKNYHITGSVAVLVVPVEAFFRAAQFGSKRFSSYSVQPSIDIDVSIQVDTSIPWGKIERVISEKAGRHLQEVTLFDRYSGEGVEAGAVAYGIRMRFQSASKTLTMKEIEDTRDAVIEELKKQCGAIHRY